MKIILTLLLGIITMQAMGQDAGDIQYRPSYVVFDPLNPLNLYLVGMQRVPDLRRVEWMNCFSCPVPYYYTYHDPVTRIEISYGCLKYDTLDYSNHRYFTSLPSTSPVNMYVDRADVDKMPYANVADIASANAYIMQPQPGMPVNIRNGGADGTLYVVDGVVIMR
jgi:hypothetical protein